MATRFNVYSPENTTTTQDTAKFIITGQRFVPENPVWVTGYRVYTVIGNTYRIYSVIDPDGTREISELLNFEADASGWVSFGVSPRLVGPGDTFDLVVQIAEPDPTPTVFSGDWYYDTPNNPGVPSAGTIIHANNSRDIIDINKTDDNAGDRSAELEGLLVGDIIERGATRWSIQSVTDNGTYMSYGVSPSTQAPTDGVATVNFETVTATPISYEREVDKWVGDPRISGLLAVEQPYESITPDDNQYCVDLLVQDVSYSECWEAVSYDG